MASSLENSAWLQWMATVIGQVSRQTYAATLAPDLFYCVLDELPLHLMPQRVQRPLQRKEDRAPVFFLNPECVVCSGDRLPDRFASRKDLLAGFAIQGTVAWVRSGTGTLLPFWLGPQLETMVLSLRPNEPVPPNVPESTVRLLSAADILISETQLSERNRTREELLAKASLRFRESGYAPLGELIHPFHIAALRRYYRHQIRTGVIRFGDHQSPRRFVAYNDPVARFFHHEIATTLSAVAGEALKPSYVYMASYLSGADLKRHTDREQCEFSVTLCLDFSPEPVLETPWPIRLDTPTGLVTVYQALGDGLAYRGTQLPHYRDVLPEGRTSTSIFFHYVAASFTGSLD